MIIDADSHFIPIDVYKYVNEQYLSQLPVFGTDVHGRLKIDITNDPNPWSDNPLPAHFHNNYQGFYDVSARLQDFQRLHIDFQILNPQEHAMRFSYRVNKELAKEMAYSYNRVLLDTIKAHPKKFHGPLLLPLQDVDWCLAEIKWGVENGFTSVMIDNAWVNEHNPFASLIIELPRINEIFKICEENDLLISFHHQMHQTSFQKNSVYKTFNVNSLFPSHHKLLLITLITSGVFRRYPNLKALISEGGMKFILDSFNYLENKVGIDAKKYFQKNLWFTVEPEETIAFENSVDKFGSERFLFATDYPHEDTGGQMKLQDWLLIEKLGLDQSQLENICYKNAINIFKLDL